MTREEKKRIAFVRLVLWFGIVADFINFLQYVFPESMLVNTFGITESITPFTRFIFIQAAALMAAWTMLLVWADRDPIQRRGVLLLTVPIAIGIGYSFYYLVASGVISKTWIVFLAAPVTTAGLFFAAYLTACQMSILNVRPESAG